MASDLEIDILEPSAPGTYEVQVDSPAGTATGTLTLDARSILERRRELAASVLASAVTSRSAFTALEEPVRGVGEELFAALFTGRVYGRYTASLQEAARRGEPLRVVLRLRAPELAGLPWEAMFDPEDGEYLCQREPVVRYVEAAKPSAPLTAIGPLRILGMVASPRDLPTLDAAEERRRLDDALGDLAGQGLVEVAWVGSGTWPALQQALMGGQWHVLHVIGHGGTGPTGGVLALEDEATGGAAEVSAGRFARLLHACRPVPRLVVLNSCQSGESAADDVLSSTAAALVHSGISAAVAMQFAVTDPAALAFSRGFYQALARNIPVDEAVRLGRIAIDGTSEQTLEWVTPVVYLRTDDTRLFDFAPGSHTGPDDVPTPREEVPREAAEHGLYVQALAAERNEQYDDAVALLSSVLTMDPDYRDAAERLEQIRRSQQIATAYAAAVGAEERGDTDAALRGYDTVLDLDPQHADARARHDACERRVRVASLVDELRLHAASGDWAAVAAVSTDLAAIDPEAADPDGLATRAREELGHPGAQVPTKREEETGESSTPERFRRWWIVAGVGALVLVLAGVVLVAASLGQTGAQGDGSSQSARVPCWNGDSADSAAQCPLPTGPAGLATIFPTMDDRCVPAPNLEDPGIAEQYLCDQGNFLLRVTRWDRGADRFAWLDAKNTDQGPAWKIGGTTVGKTWTRVDSGPGATRPYKWSATYDDEPYVVTIAAADKEALRLGIRSVHAKKPGDIGKP